MPTSERHIRIMNHIRRYGIIRCFLLFCSRTTIAIAICKYFKRPKAYVLCEFVCKQSKKNNCRVIYPYLLMKVDLETGKTILKRDKFTSENSLKLKTISCFIPKNDYL